MSLYKPMVLKDANVYLDGADYLGKATVELPKISHKTVEHQAMGISGSVEIPLPGIVEKMEGKIKFSSFDPVALKRLFNSSKGQVLDIWGSVQYYNAQTGAMEEFQVRATLLVFFKEGVMPEVKQSQEEGPEFSFSAVYYKLVVDGEEVIEVDVFNYIYKVDGQDLLEQTRTNLGMS